MRTTFQCPATGVDVLMEYEAGRLTGEYSTMHLSLWTDATDAERAECAADTERWIAKVAGHYASVEAANRALERAGVDQDGLLPA